MYKIKHIVSSKCDLLFLETHEFRNYEKIPREVLLYMEISVEVCCPGPSRSKSGPIPIQLIRCAPNNTFYALDVHVHVHVLQIIHLIHFTIIHFMHWIVIYPLDKIIHSLNNWGLATRTHCLPLSPPLLISRVASFSFQGSFPFSWVSA